MLIRRLTCLTCHTTPLGVAWCGGATQSLIPGATPAATPRRFGVDPETLAGHVTLASAPWAARASVAASGLSTGSRRARHKRQVRLSISPNTRPSTRRRPPAARVGDLAGHPRGDGGSGVWGGFRDRRNDGVTGVMGHSDPCAFSAPSLFHFVSLGGWF